MANSNARFRVLVYNMQPRLVAATVSGLADQGFEVSGTTSEADALARFQSGACDLLLFNLPAGADAGSAWTLVMLRAGGRSAIAVPAPLARPLFALDEGPDALRQIMGQVRALKEAAQSELLPQLLAVAGAAATGGKAESAVPARLAEALAKLLGAQVWAMASQDGALTVAAAAGAQVLPQPLAEKMCQSALEKDAPLLLLDAATAPQEWQRELTNADKASAFALPLKAAGGAVGAAAFARGSGIPLTKHEVQLASLFQPLLALAVDHERRASQAGAEQGELAQLREQLERREQEIRALNNLLQSQQPSLVELQDKVQTLRKRYLATLQGLVNVVETGDQAQEGPSEKAAGWMGLLAKPLGLVIEGLAEAAYLHDLGMPRLSSTQLEQPAASQQQLVLRHPFLAERLAETLGFPLEIRLALKHHHEHFDGSGHPDGLAGENIPLGARLLRVVDELVSLTSGDKPLSAAEALVALRAGAGRQYDPRIVETLGQLISGRSGRPASEAISTVSHELRSPLTFLVGYSELLAAQKDLPDEAKERAKEIHQEAIHMSKLVEDLLSVSRYESGRVEFHWQEADLAQLVARAVSKAKAKTTRHQVEARLPAGPLAVRTDPDKLMEVLDNLLDNAVKYAPDGGQVLVRVEREADQLSVSVSDQGIGIPEEQQGRLFEKFYRVDSPLKQVVAGTGLGLSLCKHIVEAHGGRIWVESGGGRGSTFHFSLPL